MKKGSLILLVCVLIHSVALSQISNISGIVNTYVKVVQLGMGSCVDTIYVNSTNGFAVDDTVLLIQMKGALIDTSNTSSFGSILNYNNAGNYEFAFIDNIGPNYIKLKSGLTRVYSVPGAVQLIKVPSYNNVNVSGLLTAASWNGSTGGVLAIFANSSVNLSANIDVSGKGFHGGDSSLNVYSTWFTGYYCSHNSGRGGDKGEGISFVSIDKYSGRGANSSGGGGGNDINTAAGGGGNGGAGGHGGNNFYAPSFLWGDGGKQLDHSLLSNKVFLGGGGGGGHQNNLEGTAGGNGGGIIFIITPNLAGNGYSINSNGVDVNGISTIDAAGGGGAGGSIYLDVQNFNGNLNINVKGGKGGDQFYIPQCHGNGGGGGGGAIKKTGNVNFPPNVTLNIAGGIKGVGQCNGTVNDALDGSAGLILTNLVIPVAYPVLADAGPDHVICSGTTVQLGIPGQQGIIYTWNNGAGNVPNPVVSPSATTTYHLTVNQLGACSQTDSDSVTVYVLLHPQASFTYSTNCSGLQLAFTNTSVNDSAYIWNFGDGATSLAQNPVHLYPDSGWYNVQLIVIGTGGCTDTLGHNIYVNLSQYPQSNFSIDTTNCSLNVLFTSNSINATNLIWNFGDGNTSIQSNPNHTFYTSGTFQVYLIANNVCGTDTSFFTLTLDPILVPSSSFTYDTTKCSPIVSFINTSANIISQVWNFGDGDSDTASSPTHLYSLPGNYLVSLIAINGCGVDSTFQSITLDNFDAPIASFTSSTLPCDSNVVFVNSSQNSLNYFWNFGDGNSSIDNSPNHMYMHSGIYEVLLIATNECGSDSAINQVNMNISAPPTSLFSFSGNACSSKVKFLNLSSNDFEWVWDFGDNHNSTLENLEHVYDYPGIYTVMLIVNASSGCQDTSQMELTIDDGSLSNVFIPNAFTPNGDGLNDYFELYIPELCEEFSLTIYNRWGQLIFETSNLKNRWDGRYNGSDVPGGVYYYLISGKIVAFSGSVSILR